MTNIEAKDTLNAMMGLMSLALMKEQFKEIGEEEQPTTTLINRFREAVKIACDAIDVMDEHLSIEKKDDGTE